MYDYYNMTQPKISCLKWSTAVHSQIYSLGRNIPQLGDGLQ